ncbi:unnamed protein product [Clavelina lepadiformis]|uniref:Group XV phospholipase A2 n=1 Tax=Clavelina lepadiformis TaxID=159417 RepID=A0ABP0FHK7_CLALP
MTLHINLQELIPKDVPCQVQAMQLFFDPKTNKSLSREGIEIRIPGFGNTHDVEYIDDSWLAYFADNVGAYAHNLVEALVSNGYIRGRSVRGASFDFRLSMASNTEYFLRLRKLIESTYADNSNTNVALISHSMGGLYTTWFLNHQSQAWKDKYIHSFISLSTPWAGSTESLQAIVSGFTFHVPLLNPLVVRTEQRSWESNFLLLPNAKVWPSGKVFILTDKRNYTAQPSDVADLLQELGLSTDIYHYVRDANDPKNTSSVLPPHPEVTTYCMYGTELATDNVYDYRAKTFPDVQPIISTVPGDGTVSHESLSSCKEWGSSKTVEMQFPSASHTDMLKGKDPINAVLKILLQR